MRAIPGNNALGRRQFIKSAAAATAGASWLVSPPALHAKPRVTLRVLGTHVTLQEIIRRRAQQELDIDIEFQAKGSAAVLQKASMRPESFDLYEQWSNSINVLWQANAIQPIEKNRIERWNEINALSQTGRLTADSKLGSGDAPHRILHVQPDGELGTAVIDRVSFLPYVHNVDSFGYNSAVIPKGEPYQTESWGWLLDDQYRGRVALVNEPTIGLFDAALAAQARGLVAIEDIGNMSRNEIDELFEVLLKYKRDGHFSGLWNSVPQSVDYIKSGRVVIESMFSPAVATLNGLGVPVVYAAPREGYRAWHGVMCMSARTTGHVRDAAYRFMNWWLSGWAGAFIARQGYYISNPERARDYLTDDEWDYWYNGQPARRDLPGTDGSVVARTGSVRNGSSYTERFSNVAVWNTVMDTYEYSLIRWYELVTI